MTSAYRHKLLNWLCTIGLVLVASVLMPLQFWFVTLPEHQSRILGHVELVSIAGPLGETLIYYVFVTPLALLWHWADFIEGSPPRSRFAQFALRYRLFLALIAISTVLYSLMLLGVWKYNSCDELPDALFWECIVYPSPFLVIPWLAVVVCALALGLFKASYSVWSIFKRLK